MFNSGYKYGTDNSSKKTVNTVSLVIRQPRMDSRLCWLSCSGFCTNQTNDTQTQLMFGLVSLNQNKVVTYMLINLYLVCLETSPPFIHRKSGRSAQEGKGAGDWWIGTLSAVMQTVYQPAVMKRKLRLKEELSINRSVYVPTVMYDHELWIVTERMRFQIQGASKGSLALP